MIQMYATLTVLLLGGLSASGCAVDRTNTPAPTLFDLTQETSSVPSEQGDVPPQARLRAFVPWDSAAVLAVMPPGAPHAGALVVRYGKTAEVDAGGAATIYLLEPPGAAIEPIAIEWQPAGGADLRAIARVDGELRRYDFDRR